MNLDDIFYNLKTNFSEFLSRRFRIAMSELKKINNIRICKADKGGKVVVMDYLCYSSQMKELLSNSEVYQQIKRNPLHMMQNEFNYGIKKLAREYDVSFLKKFSSRLPSLPYIYGLPKIHKKDIPLRPIISNINAPSYRLSKWLARQLSPLLGSFSDAHLRHNTDLLIFLRNIIPHNNTFISFDVAALFTNVPLKPTLDFLKRKLISSSTGSNFKSDVPVDCLLHLIDLCLKNSCFQFENNYYKQIFGIAMGNPLSPVLASLFLEHVESEMLPGYSGVQPIFWKRYVDDVLSLVSKNFDLENYLDFINSLYPTLKFTYEWESNNKIPFLVVLIHNCRSRLKFSVFRKSRHICIIFLVLRYI